MLRSKRSGAVCIDKDGNPKKASDGSVQVTPYQDLDGYIAMPGAEYQARMKACNSR